MHFPRFIAPLLAALWLSACTATPAIDTTASSAPIVPVERADLDRAPLTLTALDRDDEFLHIKMAQAGGSDVPLFIAPQPAIYCPFSLFSQAQPFPTALCPFGPPGSATGVNTTPSTEFTSAGNLIYAPNNQIRNSTMVGAVAADGVERVTNGNFALNPVSGSQSTVLNGWQWTIGAGTGTVVWNGSNAVTITGDGTNAARIGTGALTTLVGHVYTITADITNGAVTVQAGTSAFGSQNITTTSITGGATGQKFQFTATATSTFINFARTPVGSGIIANVSVIDAGALPTNWTQSITGLTGLPVAVASVSSSEICILIAGTPTTTNAANISFDTSVGIPSGLGQSWLAAAALRLGGGSQTNAGNLRLVVSETNAGGSTLIGEAATSAITLTGAAQSFSGVVTTTNASVAHVIGQVFQNFTSGNPVNITLCIGNPQMQGITPAQASATPVFYATSGSAYFGPRITYDPSTSPATATGYLPEQQHVNLVTASFGNFNNATYWTKSTVGDTVTDANATGPMGASTLSTFADSSTNAPHAVSSASISFTSGTTYTLSALGKAGTNNLVQLTFGGAAFTGGGYANFDFNSCGNPVASGGTFVAAGGMNEGNGVCRVWLAETATGSTPTTGAISRINSSGATRSPAYAGTGTTILIGEADVIANSFPLLMAPTYGATTTVNADVMSIPAPACAQNPSRLMFVGKVITALGLNAGNEIPLELNVSAQNRLAPLSRSNTGSILAYSRASNVQTNTPTLEGSSPNNTAVKFWTTYQNTGIHSQVIGLSAQKSAALTLPAALTAVQVGSSIFSSEAWNAPIPSFSLYCSANDNFAFQKASGQ